MFLTLQGVRRNLSSRPASRPRDVGRARTRFRRRASQKAPCLPALRKPVTAGLALLRTLRRARQVCVEQAGCAQCGASYTKGVDLFCARCGNDLEPDAFLPSRPGRAAHRCSAPGRMRRAASSRCSAKRASDRSLHARARRSGRRARRRRHPIRGRHLHVAAARAARAARRAALAARPRVAQRHLGFIDQPTRLTDGDLVLIGSQLLRFRRLGYPGPHPPEADATRRMGSIGPQRRTSRYGTASCRWERVATSFICRPRRRSPRPRNGRLGLPLRSDDERTPRGNSIRGQRVLRPRREQPQRRRDGGARRTRAAPGQRLLVGDQILRVESV